MPHLRKYSLAFLLLLNGLPLLLSIGFSLHQMWIRHEMLEKLESEKLHVITLENHNLQWEQEGKELMIAGRMFDVKNFELHGDKLIVYGLFDDEETMLYQQLENSHAGNNDDLLLKRLCQLFNQWHGEKPTQIFIKIHIDVIIKSLGITSEMIPTYPYKKGLIKPPDFNDC